MRYRSTLVNAGAIDVKRSTHPAGRTKLQQVARYVEELTEYRAHEACFNEETEDDEIDKRPDDVPSKTTITIKEIKHDQYYY